MFAIKIFFLKGAPMSTSKITITPVTDQKTIAEFQKTANEQLPDYKKGMVFETVSLFSDGKEQFLIGTKKHHDEKSGNAFSQYAIMPLFNNQLSGECLVAEARFRPAGENDGYPYDIKWPDQVYFDAFKNGKGIISLHEKNRNFDVTDNNQLRFWLEDGQHQEMKAYRVSTDSKEQEQQHNFYEKRKREEFETARKLTKRFFTPSAEQQAEYEHFKDEELSRQKRVKAFGRTRKLVEKKWEKEAQAAKRKEQEEAKKQEKAKKSIEKNNRKRFKQNFLGD